MPNKNSVAERIRWLRESKGYSLQRLAKVVDCDAGYLSKLESGKARNPSERFLTQFRIAMRVRQDWLLRGEGEPFWGSGEDEAQKTGVPQETLQTAMGVSVDLPDILDAQRVLSIILRGLDLDQVQQLWRSIRALPGLPVPARLFWNETFLRCQSDTHEAMMAAMQAPVAGGKKELPTVSLKGNPSAVTSELSLLIKKLNYKTSRRGAKRELARFLDVAPARITEWLKEKKEPGGDYALRLLKWVETAPDPE